MNSGRFRRGRSFVVLASTLVAVLAGSASASAASLSPVDPSPADGARIQTTDKGATLTFAWAADRAGCTSASSTVKVTFMGPRPFTRTVGGALPNGSVEIDFQTSTMEDTFSWFVSMTCNATDDVSSETRTFTNLPPDPAPRFAGRYLVNARGIQARRWTLRPRCGNGACNTFLKIPGQPRFLLRYNARKRTYTGMTRKAKGTCRVGFFRTVRNGLKGSIHVQVRVTDTTVEGARTFAETLRGRITTKFTPTARGRRLGCRRSSARAAITFNR